MEMLEHRTEAAHAGASLGPLLRYWSVPWMYRARRGEKMYRAFSYWNTGSSVRDQVNPLPKRQNGQVRKLRVMNEWPALPINPRNLGARVSTPAGTESR